MSNQASGPICLRLPDELRAELARIADERRTTEVELVESAVRRLIGAEQAPGLPRFARRLGPIADT